MIATTTASVWRAASVEDDRGDEVDAPLTEVSRAIKSEPAAVTEKSRRVFNPESQRWESVRAATGRLYPRHQVLKGDRLRDDRTGVLYSVEEVTPVRGLGGRTELLLDLRTL